MHVLLPDNRCIDWRGQLEHTITTQNKAAAAAAALNEWKEGAGGGKNTHHRRLHDVTRREMRE